MNAYPECLFLRFHMYSLCDLFNKLIRHLCQTEKAKSIKLAAPEHLKTPLLIICGLKGNNFHHLALATGN